jgi:hypothetical protein
MDMTGVKILSVISGALEKNFLKVEDVLNAEATRIQPA